MTNSGRKPIALPEDLESLTKAEIYGLWEAGILSWKLWAQQLKIYERIRNVPPEVWLFVILCARQYGKSVLAVLMGIEDCIRYPDTGVLIIGPTIDQTFSIVEPRMKMLTRDAPPGFITPIKSEKKWIIGESELYVGGFDKVSAGQRGKTLQNIYIEEVRDSHPDKYSRTMRGDLGPALTHSKGGRMNFVTTLPDMPDHPFVIDTIEQAKEMNAFESYTIDDNDELTEVQKQRVIEMSGGPESEETKRELYNIQTRNRKRTIAPDFDEKLHVQEFSPPDQGFYHVTTDWGGVRDKTVGLLHTYDFINNVIMICDEIKCDENTSTPVVVAGLKSLDVTDINSRYADVSGQLAVDLTLEHDYPCMLPPKSDWIAAANNLSAIFSFLPVRILIHPRCKFLIATLRSGMFNKQRTDFDRTEFLGHMDAAAALMYAIRVQLRENPFGAGAQSAHFLNVFHRPPPPQSTVVAESMQAKPFSFGTGSKSFGKFKR